MPNNHLGAQKPLSVCGGRFRNKGTSILSVKGLALLKNPQFLMVRQPPIPASILKSDHNRVGLVVQKSGIPKNTGG